MGQLASFGPTYYTFLATALRHALVAAATDAGVRPLVRCSAAFVETPLLLSSEGAVLTLLNWGDTSPGR